MRTGANPNPMDSIRRLPGYRPAADTTRYLTDERLRRLPTTGATAWRDYLERSRAAYARDTAMMNAELRDSGKGAMERGPYADNFAISPAMTARWFAGDSARRIADAMLSFQAPNGGWSKHVDFSKHPRAAGESYFSESADWEWISTIDNGSTTEEIRFLAKIDSARREPRYEAAIGKGVEYLLEMQMPTGCMPQVYPLEGSYHDAATFNDNATTNALRVLRDASAGQLSGVSDEQRVRAATALKAGLNCLLASQIRVNGKPVVWAQQHDPLSLGMVSARSYEPATLAPQETAAIVDYLMELSDPGERVVRSVYAATDWLAAHQLHGLRYEHYVLTRDAKAPPLWGRMIELETNRVVMANRDGVRRYDWNELTDRRSGYQWYTAAPAATLARFVVWSKIHPRPPAR